MSGFWRRGRARRKFEKIFGSSRHISRQLAAGRARQTTINDYSRDSELIWKIVLVGVDLDEEVPALIGHRPGLDTAGAPLLIALHQTTQDPQCGMYEVAGLKGDPALAYGREAALLGAVVVAPSYPLFSGYHPDIEQIYREWRYASVSQKGVVNHARAIDVLRRYAGGRTRPVSAIGHSLGGSNAVFQAAFDDRIAAVVCSAGLSTFESYAAHMPVGLAGWALRDKYMPLLSERYENDPALAPADFDDILVAASSARLRIVAPRRDDVFPYEGAQTAVERARRRLGRKAIDFDAPDCGHAFPAQARRTSYRFLGLDR